MKRFRKLAVLVGAASLAGAGLIVACSSSDNGTTPTPGLDAAKTDTGNPDTSVGPTPEAGSDAGPDANCTKPPQLGDNTAGFRCAFQDAGGADGGASPCTNTQECCNTESKATGPGYCANGKDGTEAACIAQMPAGSTFNAGKGHVWECADKSACAAGQTCCMIQDPARLALDPVKNKLNIGKSIASDAPKYPVACGFSRVFNEGGSRCKTACLATDIKLCSLTDMNCGAGTTCTPFIDFSHSVDRGYCK